MRRIDAMQYQHIVKGARVLADDEHGVKVLLTPDDRIVKHFRRKRWLSSTLLYPYVMRFAYAARALEQRGVDAPRVELVARVPHIQRDIVVYKRLPGQTLRESLADASPQQRDRLVEQLARTLASLHEQRVYFRAAHFGNFLVPCDDQLALSLIDISEARIRRLPMTMRVRARNFRSLTSYAEDLEALRAYGIDRFLECYSQFAGWHDHKLARFSLIVRRMHPLLMPASGRAPPRENSTDM